MEISGVRLDSGDLAELSGKVRSLLPNIQIFASGDLDEWEIKRLQETGASIDGYGLGTKLVTGTPVNGVYKLVEIAQIPTMKSSENKVTYPGRKQIFRSYHHGQIIKDRLALAEEKPEMGEEPLLELVMKDGKSLRTPESLATIQKRTRKSVISLPQKSRELAHALSVEVEISSTLQNLLEKLKNK